jgi:hypothetical protein
MMPKLQTTNFWSQGISRINLVRSKHPINGWLLVKPNFNLEDDFLDFLDKRNQVEQVWFFFHFLIHEIEST